MMESNCVKRPNGSSLKIDRKKSGQLSRMNADPKSFEATRAQNEEIQASIKSTHKLGFKVCAKPD